MKRQIPYRLKCQLTFTLSTSTSTSSARVVSATPPRVVPEGTVGVIKSAPRAARVLFEVTEGPLDGLVIDVERSLLARVQEIRGEM